MTETTTETARPTVTGPVSGGAHGWPFGATVLDPADHGMVEEEFFLEGTATRYRMVGGAEASRDGRWTAEPAETAPYRTRILVQRPTDPARFNGTAIVVWNNVTAGYELFNADWDTAWKMGFAVVSVTCQKVAIEGLPGLDQGMRPWDPERYGDLSIPSDDYSYDVFDQAARAVGPDRDRAGVDPMGGLDVQRLVAFGASQSAGRLGTQANAVQPLTGTFDAIVLAIYFGRGSALEVGDEVVNIMRPAANRGAGGGLVGANLVRDDLDARVMVVNSELEATACHDVRQPDTDRFVYWEAAGTCHVSAQSLEARAARYEREFGTPPPARQRGGSANRVPVGPLYDAALHHIQRWLTDGTPPPSQPKIEFAGEPPEIVRDDDRLALGGIRLPQVEVPLAHNSAIPWGDDIFSRLDGRSEPFDADVLRERYGDEATYLARFTEALDRAIDAGVVLDLHRDALLAEAADDIRRGLAG